MNSFDDINYEPYGTIKNSQPNLLNKTKKSYSNSRDLYKRLNKEYNSEKGIICTYFVCSFDDSDNPVFGEDNNIKFLRKFDVALMFDSLPEDEFIDDEMGMFFDDSVKSKVDMNHFLEMSKYASKKTPKETGVNEGYTYLKGKKYKEYKPHIGDIVRLKSGTGDFYFEIIHSKLKDGFLQGTHAWELTLKRMKDSHNEISDEYDQKDIMNDIEDVLNNGKDELDVTEEAEEELEGYKYDATDDPEPIQPKSDGNTINSGGNEDNYIDTGGWFGEF